MWRAPPSFVAIAIAACSAQPAPAPTSGGGGGASDGPYSANMPALHTVWTFPPAPTNANGKIGFWNIDARVTVMDEPGPSVAMFWAATFGIENSGGGGYIGFQDGAPRSDGATGRVALLSIWNASGATPGPGAACRTFGGEGDGYTCRIDYAWLPGHTYRLRVWAIPPVAWRGAILDEQTGVDTVLGDITVPEGWGWLHTTLDEFTENFAENGGTRYPTCADAPRTLATFFSPIANQGQATVTTGVGQVNTNANCTNVSSSVASDLSHAIEQMNTD